MRQLLVQQSTAIINRARGILAERGIVIAQSPAAFHRAMPEVLASDNAELTQFCRGLLTELLEHLRSVQERIAEADEKIKAFMRSSELCKKISALDGVGPITATAVVVAVGDASGFRNGRHFAAWLGVVPRQYSSGGKSQLLEISKRGDTSRLAAQALLDGVRGSSAGGEFPKFTAVRRREDGQDQHVLVKFSGSDDAPGTRRWADLLVCEHLASEVLSAEMGVATATSRIHSFEGRVFLEVDRFDRHGALGRSGLLSWFALNAACFGTSGRPSSDAARRLAERGWLSAEDRQRIVQLWHFASPTPTCTTATCRSSGGRSPEGRRCGWRRPTTCCPCSVHRCAEWSFRRVSGCHAWRCPRSSRPGSLRRARPEFSGHGRPRTGVSALGSEASAKAITRSYSSCWPTTSQVERLYLVRDRGGPQQAFDQLEVWQHREVADQRLTDDSYPPDSVERYVEEAGYRLAEEIPVGEPQYQLHRAIDVAAFVSLGTWIEGQRLRAQHARMKSLTALDARTGEVGPLDLPSATDAALTWKGLRIFQDWTLCSAGRSGARICKHWAMQISDWTSAEGERHLSLIPLWTTAKPPAEVTSRKLGDYELYGRLLKIDERMGVPMAYYFFALHGNRISSEALRRVLRAAESGLIVMPEHDYQVLRRWGEAEYGF